MEAKNNKIDFKGKVTYISGKISGLEKHEYMKHFSDAEEFIRRHNGTPVNPAIFGEMYYPFIGYFPTLKACLAMLDGCDAIYMLKGYEDSYGAMSELGHAKVAEMDIFYEDE